MRRWFRAGKAVVSILCAAVCGIMLYSLLNVPLFAQGSAYTFYLGASSSSLAVVTRTPVLTKLLLGETAGESTVYEGNCYEELKERYRAELLFSEEACGTVNYYLYSPVLGGGVMLDGYLVNLHVAVSERGTAAGSPLIFGGF